jgi:hypothetical protein
VYLWMSEHSVSSVEKYSILLRKTGPHLYIYYLYYLTFVHFKNCNYLNNIFLTFFIKNIRGTEFLIMESYAVFIITYVSLWYLHFLICSSSLCRVQEKSKHFAVM